MHKTSAWPLSLIYASLIVYASLYPFAEWRDQGISPFSYLWQPLPKYWTGFDIGINIVGYTPLGFLVALAALRTGRGRGAVLLATTVACLLSLSLETVQGFLTSRVPSNVDLALNLLGALLGAVAATLLEKAGALDRWSRIRSRWFVNDARGGLVLLALWPIALLYPAAVPLGLGQVLERLEETLAAKLADTPFLEWLPVRAIELQPMTASAEMLCVMLGALTPCLLGFCVIRGGLRRGMFVVAVMACAIGVTAMTAALSFGPFHAWAWLGLPAQVGLLLAFGLACTLLLVRRRFSAALAILCLGVYLSIINQASNGPYFEQTLHAWEQGRFIRFNGVTQWLAWTWPYATLIYVLILIARPETRQSEN